MEIMLMKSYSVNYLNGVKNISIAKITYSFCTYLSLFHLALSELFLIDVDYAIRFTQQCNDHAKKCLSQFRRVLSF
jgi:hypothetical protein